MELAAVVILDTQPHASKISLLAAVSPERTQSMIGSSVARIPVTVTVMECGAEEDQLAVGRVTV